MIYLFDLDGTLVRTSDLEAIREAGKDDDSSAYRKRLEAELSKGPVRPIWSEEQISRLVQLAPLSTDEKNYVGVFTSAPRSYAYVLLEKYFPGTEWAVVLGYEDIKPHFKPHGYGLKLARETIGQDRIMVIGDTKNDILCAYHGVADVAWYEAPNALKPDYYSRKLLPDFVFSDVDDLLTQLQHPERHMMCLDFGGEVADGATGMSRTVCCFDPEGNPHYLRVFGKYFPESHAPWKGVRALNALSSEIMESKDAVEFPLRWQRAINQTISEQFQFFGRNRPFGRVVLTCLPPRPGRLHRMGNLVRQCEKHYLQDSRNDRVIFEPDLFEYGEGVLSNSKDGLNKDERFQNIRQSLALNKPDLLTVQDIVIVIDDVVTTGSSLIRAKELLEGIGLRHPQLVAMGRTIGNFMPTHLKDVALYDPD